MRHPSAHPPKSPATQSQPHPPRCPTPHAHHRRPRLLHELPRDRDRHGSLPVVFLHGNPVSSYIWRNVLPHVAPRARCLAPDLIGMGESAKPDLAYRFADHARFLDAWFDAMNLGDVVLVGHDRGGALAMDWAARRADRVRGVAVLETFLRPVRSEELAPPVADVFRRHRSAEGDGMVLEKNMVIEVNLVRGVLRGLSESDLDVYRAPFRDPASRKPMLAWTREFLWTANRPTSSPPSSATAAGWRRARRCPS